MAEAKLEIKLDNEDVTVKEHTLFGMKFPDGSIEWGWVNVGVAGRQELYFQHLADGEAGEVRAWNQHLRRKAEAAKIDVDTYKAAHTLLQRKIILSAGEVEEWGHGGTLTKDERTDTAAAEASTPHPWSL